MLKNIFRVALIIVLAIGSWLVVQASVAQFSWSLILLLTLQYLLIIVVFGLVFGAYYRTPFDRFSAGTTAILALVGIVAWQLTGPNTPSWSIFGWLIPTLLAGAVVYGRRELFRG